MNQDKQCTANFSYTDDPNIVWHKLSVQIAGLGNGIVNNPGRIDCGENCTADQYKEGVTTYLRVTADELSKFTGWTGDCQGKQAEIKLTISQDMTCTANFQSSLEIITENMVDAFYANAKLADKTSVAEAYPRINNEERIKEAFQFAIKKIMVVDEFITSSNSQQWLTQFNGIEWLPDDSSANYTNSIKLMESELIGILDINVDLLAANGIEQTTEIIIHYSNNPPDDVSRWGNSSAYFSRHDFWPW
ncbi:MAG: hypothetical protein QM487_08105 [Candidatus Marithrix sp.]